jgi:hypothetical protein
MRLVLVRKTHIYLKHPAARGADKMMMMVPAGFVADKEEALPVITVHAVYQPAAHEPVYRPVDGGKADWAPKRFGQGILDLLRRKSPMVGLKALQERRYYGRHPSAVLAQDFQVLGGEIGSFSGHTLSLERVMVRIKIIQKRYYCKKIATGPRRWGSRVLVVAKPKETCRDNNFAYTGEREEIHVTLLENNYSAPAVPTPTKRP